MEKWTNCDIFIIDHLVEESAALKNALEVSRKNNLVEAEVSSAQGKFLYLLARIKNAKRILELGTLGGYSTIWLAQAVGDDGVVLSVEYVKEYANVAKQNIEFAGFSDRVKIIHGDASDVLEKLIDEQSEPFDMIFLDADKPSYSKYLELSLQLSKSGTIIYGDNVVRDGELGTKGSTDEKVIGVQRFIEDLGKQKTIESIALQTVGIKGYDGFTLSIVK
jgi:predicted O-methyltransferase YrrM